MAIWKFWNCKVKKHLALMKICFGFKQQPWWAKKQWRNCGPPCIYFFSNCSTVSLSCTMSEAGLLLPLTFKKDPSLFAHSHSNIFFLLFSQELLLLVAFLQTHAPDSKEKTLLFRSKNPLQTTFSITSFLRLLYLKIATKKYFTLGKIIH